MKIKLSSVFVEDQDKALQFYTEVLGFVKKNDMSLGEFKWLTVVSPEGSDEFELLLEPNAHPAAKAFQEAIYQDGIPATSFFVENLQEEYERLKKLGAVFKTEPTTNAEWGTYAIIDDTCGNLIHIQQE